MIRILAGLSVFFYFLGVIDAQIVLEEVHLPAPDDTLLMATDQIPTNISLGSGGADQTWQFSNLQAPFPESYFVRNIDPAVDPAEFSDADFKIEFNASLTGYYKKQGTYLRFLGTAGMDPLELGLNVPVRIEDDGVIERKFPLRYGDQYESDGAILVAFASEDLPREVLEQLPIRPDSFRIKSAVNRVSEIDGWGTLLTEAGNFQVLREKRVESFEVSLEAKFLFLPWQDITDLLPENDLLGNYQINSFHYLSTEAKEPIAIVYTDENERDIERVEFKSGDIITKLSHLKTNRPSVLAFPNPAIISVRYQFSNLPTGKYQLKIFSLLGKELWHKEYYITGEFTDKMDITFLRKGAYFYSLVDEAGTTLMTRRLVVLRP